MRLSLRLFLGYFLIVALAAWFVLSIFSKEIKPGVRSATESTLLDAAKLLAGVASGDMAENNIAHGRLAQAFQHAPASDAPADISGIMKHRLEYRVYVTDAHGYVVFDSTGQDVGKDYSRWNDVFLTLRGQYGARSTRSDPEDDNSSVMYVASPIYVSGKLAGVLTVSKPNRALAPVIERSERKIMQAGVLLLGLALLIGGLMVWWINRAIRRLVAYAETVASGEKASLPRLGSPELTQLGWAIEAMRRQLEGKEYVERYVSTLSHELKSPLAAIHGAAELLKEVPPIAAHQRFVGHILLQSQRMQQLIERLLHQAHLEAQLHVDQQALDWPAVIQDTVDSKSQLFLQHKLALNVTLEAAPELLGDKLLLTQALSNVLDNAMAFSPEGGSIALQGRVQGPYYLLQVRDHGCGIPDYALPRVFERFYSLARPLAPKSTGLGLNLVREVMQLHGGDVQLRNHPEGGVEVSLILPL